MSWLWRNLDLIAHLTWQHIVIAVPSILLTLLIAVPLARLSQRNKVIRTLTLSGAGIVYAIPSLAVFVVLPSLLGTRILDVTNVVVALTLYGIALLTRSAMEAFDAVDADVRAAAQAQGLSTWQLFWQVELPLAGSAIAAGLRVVSASTLSLVSVGALIGVQSLGSLFTEGYARSFLLEIGVGIVATVLLAVVFDALILGACWLLMPWTRHRSTTTPAPSATVMVQ